MSSSGIRVALLALLWGSSFLWTKVALRGLTPEQIVVSRLFLGAVVLAAALHFLGGQLPRAPVTWLHLATAAVFGNVAPYLLFAYGLQQVDSAIGGMLNATTPVWTIVIAIVFAQRRELPPLLTSGAIVGLAGTALILAPWMSGTQFTSAGAVACLLGAVSYGVSYVYINRFLTRTGASPLTLSTGQLLAAAAISVPVTLPIGLAEAPTWRLDVVVAAVILGSLGTGAAYVLNYRVINDDGPIAAAAVIYLLPIVAIALGVAVLGEQVTTHALLGVAVVLAGVAMIRRATGQTVGR